MRTKVGVREFRENLSAYLDSPKPVAITRHGSTIGVYIPTRPRPTQSQLDAFRAAHAKMQEMMAAAGVSGDELIEEYEKLRGKRRVPQRSDDRS